MTQRHRGRPQQVRSVRRPAACGCRARLKLETLESRLPLAGVAVEGIAFADVDHDGIRGSDEPVWPGHTLVLDLNGNGLHDKASEPSVTTDASGRYQFPPLPREAVEQFFALDSAFGRVRVDLPLVSRPTLAATATIRIDENKANYQLGNQVEASSWIARRLSDWVSSSFRMRSLTWGNIHGRDTRIPTSGMGVNGFAVPTADPNLRGGTRLDALFGANFYIRRGFMKGHRFAVETGLPVYQYLDGPQLQTDWTLTAAWQYAF